MTEETAEQVAGARNAFADAVHDLVGRRPDMIERDDTTREAIVRDSLYNELQEAKHGEQVGQGSRRPAPASRPPGWTDALSLVVRIDKVVATWWPPVMGLDSDYPGLPLTVQRLYALTDWPWAPHELSDLKQRTRTVESWVERARILLPTEDSHLYELKAPCPACGETYTSVEHAGEMVQRYVLQANLSAAKCVACETSWAPENFVALSKLLGGLPANVLE